MSMFRSMFVLFLIVLWLPTNVLALQEKVAFKNFVKPQKTICSIKFTRGSSQLTREHRVKLKEFSKKLTPERYGKNTIRIEGYSDGGSTNADMKLSFERSRVVENYLLKFNPASKELFLSGFSPEQAKVASLSGRVEIVLYDDKIDLKSKKVDELVTNLSDLKANHE